jgi:DNA polymerase III delta prime subunit
MERLDFNVLLNRTNEAQQMIDWLQQFELNKSNLTSKRSIYVYGEPGTGKTTFVLDLLKKAGYDVIRYDVGDSRNKSVIEMISTQQMGDRNVLSMYRKETKKIAIVMDEIDGMNSGNNGSGDKGGISSLIKMIRPKKTKKQKMKEETTMVPIICIGNYHTDKKIKELIKACFPIELKPPTEEQIISILNQIHLVPNSKLFNYIQKDLRKLKTIVELYNKNPNVLNDSILMPKLYNDNMGDIVGKLFANDFPLEEHSGSINDGDRTIVGLLWHENIVDIISKKDKEKSVLFYMEVLDNICFSDYIDRVTFQKQIWQLNEMSSIVKLYKNNHLFHEKWCDKRLNSNQILSSNMRYTKVFTKYNTEYNNANFIQMLCQEFGMDKSDLFSFFENLRTQYKMDDIETMLKNDIVGDKDIRRMYRYLDKFTKENAETEEMPIVCQEELY